MLFGSDRNYIGKILDHLGGIPRFYVYLGLIIKGLFSDPQRKLVPENTILDYELSKVVYATLV
jgi:hypothetical protein